MAILGYIVNKSRPTLLRLILIRLRHLESQKKQTLLLALEFGTTTIGLSVGLAPSIAQHTHSSQAMSY